MSYPGGREEGADSNDGSARHVLIMIGRPMSSSSSSRRVRVRSAVAPLAVGLLLVTASACGSDSDSGSEADADTADSVAAADPPVDTATVDTAVVDTAVVDTAASDPAATDAVPVDGSVGGGDASAECGGLHAAEVGAAAGAEFDTADDISVDGDVSCLFGKSTAAEAVTVRTEPVSTYLGGSLDGLSSDEALAQLESASTMFFEDPVVEQTTVGGVPAVIVVGTAVGSGIGSASAIVDGVVIEVSSSGSGLSPDAAGYGPIVTAVLELAVAAQG
jgi:hypothetical protein